MKTKTTSKLLTGLFFFSFLVIVAGQDNPVVDSLKNQLLLLPEDSSKALVYDEICWQLLYTDPDEALKYADSTLRLSEKIQFPKGIVSGNSNIGGYHYVTGNLGKALEIYERSDSLSQAFGYKRGRRAANSNIASILFQVGDFSKSLEMHKVSMELAVEENDTIGMVKAYINQSAAYNGLGDFESSIQVLLDALQLLNQAGGDNWLSGSIHNNLCACFHEVEDFEKSVPHCKKAIKLFQEGEWYTVLPTPIFNLGDAYTTLEKRDSALYYLKLGFEYEPQDRTLYYGYSHLANWFSKENQNDSSLFYTRKAYEYAKASGLKHELATSALYLGNIYSKSNDDQRAYRFFSEGVKELEKLPGNQVQLTDGYKNLLLVKSKLGLRISADEMQRYIELRDSVFDEKKHALLNEIETRYQTRQKQDSIQVLEIQNQLIASDLNHNQNLKWLYAALLAISVILLGVLYYFFRLKKEQSRYLSRDLEKLEAANQQLKVNLDEQEKKLQSPALLAQQSIALTNREKTVLQLGDILYVRAERGAVQVVTASEKYWDWQPLKHYAAILPGELFVQSHKSYLLNKLHVKELRATTVSMSDGNELSVGKKYKDHLQSQVRTSNGS